MTSFDVYYHAFLGLEVSEMAQNHVVGSDYRDLALNQKFLYPILVSEYNGRRICSCSSQYLKICRSAYDGTVESLESIVDVLNAKGDDLRIRRFRRHAIDALDKRLETAAVALTEDHIRKSCYFGVANKDACLSAKASLLEDKREFVVIKEDVILSSAFISDFHGGGGNIVVNTHRDYRGQGYGKEVVKACINWCMENRLTPVYWVEESNAGSIRLAESTGFTLKSMEWVVSKR